jgi:hypothetical protein
MLVEEVIRNDKRFVAWLKARKRQRAESAKKTLKPIENSTPISTGGV